MLQLPAPCITKEVRAMCGGQLHGEGGSFKVEGRGTDQDLIPYVEQLEPANVPIEVCVTVHEHNSLPHTVLVHTDSG